MRRTMAPVLAVSGVMAMFALSCGGGSPGTEVTPAAKDTYVRNFIHDSLAPYIDSLAKEACAARDSAGLPSNWLCDTDHDTYTHPPSNGKP